MTLQDKLNAIILLSDEYPNISKDAKILLSSGAAQNNLHSMSTGLQMKMRKSS